MDDIRLLSFHALGMDVHIHTNSADFMLQNLLAHFKRLAGY